MNWWQSLLLQLVLTSVQVVNARYSKNPAEAAPAAAVLGAVQAAVHNSTANRTPDGNKL